jgi:hypothetical protein
MQQPVLQLRTKKPPIFGVSYSLGNCIQLELQPLTFYQISDELFPTSCGNQDCLYKFQYTRNTTHQLYTMKFGDWTE